IMKNIIKPFFSINTISLTFCTTLLVVILFVIGVPFLDMIELKTYDLRFLSRGHLKGSPEVVMAVVDEKSLDKEGRWPWPRSKIAALIDRLSQDGARVIGFDIGFLEPDENSYLIFVNQLDQEIHALNINNRRLDDFIKNSKIEADNDLALANAIRNSTATVVLGYFFHISEKELAYRIDQKEIDLQIKRIGTSKYPLTIYENKEAQKSPFIRSYAPEGNLEILTNQTDYSGFFNMLTDKDGVVRWMPLIIQSGENIFPPLALQCAWNYIGRPRLIVKVASYGIEGIQMGERFLPTDENGQMLLNYLGPPKTFPHFSITDILRGNLARGTFKDKIVLVGATAVGIYDLRITPFSTNYPGLEIHATVVDNILKKRFLSKPKWTSIYDLLAVILLGVLTGLALPRLSAVKALSFTLGLFILHIITARWLFVSFGTWFNIVYPILALLLTYTALTVYHYITEERERKKIRGAFSYYVSSSVVNEMLKNPDQLKLGGDEKDLSVLFSDIRGFTTIAEGLTPEDLVHLLNEYLTVMTDVVFNHDGTLDKYMGDAIMAIYGAPLDQPDHPARACRSALDMMTSLKELNEKWILEGKTPMDIGIGINTGMMMVGNMGSDQRFDYTVMGDAVNLGSRLEGANKNYKTNILISEYTYERVKDEFVCMEIDSVRVKGKTQPVKIYQLHAHNRVPETREKAVFYFHRGLQLYKQQKWDEAIKLFKGVWKLDNDIFAANVYIERCKDLKANPPGPDWDGCYTMKTK
ncbi:MAG: adenylate/guanylate cyclase domain-containing protein, partial [Desulfobacteraceae bacterium]|nr:adenylate/guanylate cyclase domain-containing protein [Desulfobacteraceae bacterium]